MLCCCLKYRKSTESKNPNVARTKSGRIMLLSKVTISDSQKSISIKEQKASKLSSSWGIKTLC